MGLNTNPRALNPIRWALTFLIVVIGWVIFRAENLHVAGRMYGAMFSFNEWSLSELTRANLTGLQVATLVVAYLTLAFFGLRDLYRRPTELDVSKAQALPADWSRYALRSVIGLLFVASIFKLSAQSFSPFLYFQF